MPRYLTYIDEVEMGWTNWWILFPTDFVPPPSIVHHRLWVRLDRLVLSGLCGADGLGGLGDGEGGGAIKAGGKKDCY